MSHLVTYEELVARLLEHRLAGSSGLITGVSEAQHPFQIGFDSGRIVLLVYRIFKGNDALEKIARIRSAKIMEHMGASPPQPQFDLPDSDTVMTYLSAQNGASGHDTLHDTDRPIMPQSSGTAPDGDRRLAGGVPPISTEQLDMIKAAAIHHFGPLGAFVCDDHLTASNLANETLSVLLERIAKDVGASDSDMAAFMGNFDG